MNAVMHKAMSLKQKALKITLALQRRLLPKVSK